MIDNAGTVVYSVIMAIWTVLLIEFWKREQNTLKYEWDTIDYENKVNSVRPEFDEAKFEKRLNEITNVSFSIKIFWLNISVILKF